MQTFCFIVFLISAIALPYLVDALLDAKLRLPGKTILFLLLAVASRYLLGAVWTPEKMWLLYLKSFVITVVACVIYMLFVHVLDTRKVKPVVGFAVFMLIPFVAQFCFFGSLLGNEFASVSASLFFWAVWTILAFVITWDNRKKASRLSKTIVFCIAIGLLTIFLSASTRSKVMTYAGELKECLRRNVVERWDPIRRGTEKIVATWEEAVSADRKRVAKGKIGTRNVATAKAIKRHVTKLRKELLTVDSQAVLSSIRKLDRKIASAKKKVAALREQRGLKPEAAEKLDAAIDRAETNLAALETARAEAIATARRDLKEIGLDLPENSPFLTVDLGALIDNAVVAKNIGFVVETLKADMEAAKGDAEAAKRYYGAYIVMLDVQSECFRQYLEKAATGIWRDGIADIAKNAEAARKNAEAKAAAAGRSEEERAAFLHAAGTNEKTFKVAQAYLAILQHHEDVVKEKLAATEKRHEIALSFWESVDIASSFSDRVAADMADFDALLELKIPEITFFDDVAMQEEFDAITQKLDKE